jgi:hypothetical protein
MKIIFLSHDGTIHRLTEALEGDIHGVKTEEEVLELLEDVDEDGECLLFLDFDIDSKAIEKFNKTIFKNDWLTRIIISGKMSVKEFKKHQKGKTSAHGYVLKPFTTQVFKGILNDLEIAHIIEDQNLYEEGTQLPDLPKDTQMVSGLNSIDESYLSEEADDVDFNAQEFQMNSEVRDLIDRHSVKGDRSPFEGELNDKIQMKFDEVFGEELYDDDTGLDQVGDSFMGGGGSDMDLSLKDETQESISLNLGEESTELSSTSELSIDEDNISLDEAEEIDFDEAEEIDFDEAEEIDLDEAEDIDLDEEDEIDLDEGELEFSDNEEELDASSEQVEDLDDELTRLTDSRSLPTAEELSEFDEETGELDLKQNNDEEMQFEKPNSPQTDSISLDDTGEFELNDEPTEEESVASLDNNAAQEANEVSEMSDESLDQDELLEFEDEELTDDGELSFSTEPEAEEAVEERSNDGGLDFNLGAIDDEDMDLEGNSTLEAPTDASATEDEGFELAGDTIEDMDIESHDVTEESLEKGQDLLQVEDDEDFDLGDDAILSAENGDETSEDDLELGSEEIEDSEEIENIEEDEELLFTNDDDEDIKSEFDSEELGFADDDDEEIEKTQAISLGEMKEMTGSVITGPEDNLVEEFEEELEEESLDMSDEEFEEESYYEADEELLDALDEEANDFEESTNPTVVMTEEVTKELEAMIDHESATHEFRPQQDESTTLLEEDLLEEDEIEEQYEGTLQTSTIDVLEKPQPRDVPAPEGTLNISSDNSRVPPSLSEGDAVRLQATIRQLREEREDLLKEIQNFKKENKLVEQDNLGLKAELDEAKIEISILKKRHGSEMDEMKYRLRLTDEKKLYSEEKARKLQKEFDRLQGKVRIDFNHIKQREKELESQLELVKMDSESQVQSRDKKILELKRKIDQLEFNMENVVIREQKSRDDKMKLEERLERIMKTLRGSIEVLEDDISFDSETKRKRD